MESKAYSQHHLHWRRQGFVTQCQAHSKSLVSGSQKRKWRGGAALSSPPAETLETAWSFSEPSLKLTFSSMPGTHRWVIKTCSDALKVSLSGSTALPQSRGQGRSRQPWKRDRWALPLSQLLSRWRGGAGRGGESVQGTPR